ncbi:MAG TPA: hypothetical protein VGD56_03430 [Gemmatirosa sp.]
MEHLPTLSVDARGVESSPVSTPCAPQAHATADRTALAPAARVPRARELVLRSAAEVRRTEWRQPGGRTASRVGTQQRANDAPAPGLVGLLAALRTSVCAYVCTRRSAAAPIWHILPEVKALVFQADPDRGYSDTLELLTAHAVRWTIEAFYDLPAGAPPASGRAPRAD